MKKTHLSIVFLIAFLAYPLQAFSNETRADTPVLTTEEQIKTPEASTTTSTTQASKTKNKKYKGFWIGSKNDTFSLRLGGYIQSRFESQLNESEPNTSGFAVRRSRMKFTANLFDNKYTSQFEYDFSGIRLLRAIVSYNHNKHFRLIAGQYRIAFNLEALASASTQQFVDRSLVHRIFGYSNERDTGVMVRGLLLNDKLDYFFGIYNGEGVNTKNQNTKYLYAGRLVYHISGKHGRKYGVTFSDFNHSIDPIIAFAIAGTYNETPNADATEEEQIIRATAELSALYRGFSLHTAGYYGYTNPETTNATTDYGVLSQLGYFITPKKFEAAIKFAGGFLDGPNDRMEYSLGLNYFLHNKHGIKLSSDYSVLTDQSPTSTDINHRIRAQMQIKL